MKRFPDNSRVCFIGDSLTAHNVYLQRIVDHYNKYFPSSGIRFFNCGVSGGSYQSTINFFRDDVLSHRPTHAVISFGVNDSARWLLGEERSEKRISMLKGAYEEFKENLSRYCELILSEGIELTLCVPPPYDEYSGGDQPALRGGYALMLGYADFVRAYAKEKNIEICDYHKYISEAFEHSTEPVYNPDRVHPTPHGYYLMARCFLENQGLTPDDEAPIPEYLAGWAKEVGRLRPIYGAESMVVKSYFMPYEEKMAMMEKRIEDKNWGQPVLEGFIRAFVKEMPNKEDIYRRIDELYESEIIGHYK